MRVAIRRTIRVGDEAGTELEDLGVAPHQEHQLTRDDILGDIPDLLKRAAEILRTEEIRKFDVTVARNAAKLSFKLATDKVDYVDVTVNGRPRGSRDIAGGAAEFELPVSQEFALPACPGRDRASRLCRGQAGLLPAPAGLTAAPRDSDRFFRPGCDPDRFGRLKGVSHG